MTALEQEMSFLRNLRDVFKGYEELENLQNTFNKHDSAKPFMVIVSTPKYKDVDLVRERFIVESNKVRNSDSGIWCFDIDRLVGYRDISELKDRVNWLHAHLAGDLKQVLELSRLDLPGEDIKPYTSKGRKKIPIPKKKKVTLSNLLQRLMKM